MKVGIVFLGEKGGYLRREIRGSRLYLDFDALACAHILLQMNYIQNLFEYQIVAQPDSIQHVSIKTGDREHQIKWSDESEEQKLDFKAKVRNLFKKHEKKFTPVPPMAHDYIVQWFELIVLSELKKRLCNLDYWFGITSSEIGREHFQWTRRARSGRIYNIITSKDWQRQFSPPSVFEYIVISTFKCSLRSLIRDHVDDEFHDHPETRGCIFDRNDDKPYRRISISNPNLCTSCKEIIRELEKNIRNEQDTDLSLDEPISKVLSRKWLGNLTEENSPVYNLRRNYRYNVDINSGFYKKPWEAFKDSLREKSAEWIVGGAISTAFALFLVYFRWIYHLK